MVVMATSVCLCNCEVIAVDAEDRVALWTPSLCLQMMSSHAEKSIVISMYYK